MIIDCHVHLNRYLDAQKPSLAERISILELEMRQNRVDVAVVLSSFTSNAARPSLFEIILATKDKPHLKSVAGMSISHTKEDLEALRPHLKNGDIVGLKIYPGYEPFYPFDERLTGLYNLAEEFSVPVMIHTGDTYSATGKIKYAHPIHLDEVAVDFPKVNFIICHMGNPWFVDTMEILYKNRNVYADISGLVLGDFNDRFEQHMARRFQEFVLFGVEPEKILYGTDWPIANMQSYLKFVNEIKIPLSEKNDILFRNAAKLFKISEKDSLLARYAR